MQKWLLLIAYENTNTKHQKTYTAKYALYFSTELPWEDFYFFTHQSDVSFEQDFLEITLWVMLQNSCQEWFNLILSFRKRWSHLELKVRVWKQSSWKSLFLAQKFNLEVII